VGEDDVGDGDGAGDRDGVGDRDGDGRALDRDGRALDRDAVGDADRVAEEGVEGGGEGRGG
jgi:hypothetical protein